MSDTAEFFGACLCEALCYRIQAPTKWCAHCHCSLCQRAHGAGFVTWVGVEARQFVLLEDTSLVWFASSPQAERGFCSRCGSSVLFRSSRWPGEIHVARACIAGAIDREPTAHVYTASKARWIELGDDLPNRP